MRRRIDYLSWLLLGALLSAMVLAGSCVFYPESFNVTLNGDYEQVTLEEAAQLSGEWIPTPGHLLGDYKIQEVHIRTGEGEPNPYLQDVSLLISDSPIESAGDAYSCKMELYIEWHNVGGLKFLAYQGERLPITGQGNGVLVDEGDHNSLYWIMCPGRMMVLSASKRVSGQELTKIAASVQYPPQAFEVFLIMRRNPDFVKTTLEGAQGILGEATPVPTYLPAGFQVQEVWGDGDLDAYQKVPPRLPVPRLLYLISDKEVVWTDDEYYGVMSMSVTKEPRESKLSEPGGEAVQIDGNPEGGLFVEGCYSHTLWWHMDTNPGQDGILKVGLSAAKVITREDMIKIAESTHLGSP